MPLWFSPFPGKTPTHLELYEKKVSLVVSLLAVMLMLGGFVALLTQGVAWVVPGFPSPHLSALFHRQPLGWTTMSLGIILLGILPLLRVGLAALSYSGARSWRDLLVALAVLLELLLSMVWHA
jgi:Trk-type K+ transport system membrane component